MKVYLTDGTLPTYFDNGKKSGEVTYKNSKPHGLWTEWYENGQLKSEKRFKDGERHGKHISWHENYCLAHKILAIQAAFYKSHGKASMESMKSSPVFPFGGSCRRSSQHVQPCRRPIPPVHG